MNVSNKPLYPRGDAEAVFLDASASCILFPLVKYQGSRTARSLNNGGRCHLKSFSAPVSVCRSEEVTLRSFDISCLLDTRTVITG